MSDRQRFAELLPFHVNGTLSAADSAWMEDYMRQHADAVAELGFSRLLHEHYRQPIDDPGSEVGLDRLIRRLRSVHAAGAPAMPFWRRWFASPAFAAVAATVMTVQAAVIFHLASAPQAEEQAAYRNVPAPAQPGAMLKVIFRPSADLGDILVLLRGLDARIVAGPSPAGELWIEVPRRPVAEAVAALRQSRLVDDVAAAKP